VQFRIVGYVGVGVTRRKVPKGCADDSECSCSSIVDCTSVATADPNW
jgi:hypothetical protein